MKNLLVWAIGLSALCTPGGLASRASADYIPPVFPGTGAYRRVYSASDYSYMSASVYLPGSSQVRMNGKDTAYVYTGGWGVNGLGAVDAGLQYSPTFNDWSLFASGVGVGRKDYSGPRLTANETITLQFQVVQQGANTALVVTADGVDVTGKEVEQSLTLLNVQGWSAGGPDTLKRMTSIAQSGGDNFSDGSTIQGVVWSNVTLGQDPTTAQAWSGGGTQNYPTTPGVVNINYVDAANETDNIALVVPGPNSLTLVVLGQLSGLGYWWRRRRRATP